MTLDDVILRQATTLFAPLAARQFDAVHPTVGFTRLLVLENCSVVLGGMALLLTDLSGGAGAAWSPLFWLAVAGMSTDAVCSSVLSVVTEKDWVATVCGEGSQLCIRVHRLQCPGLCSMVFIDCGATRLCRVKPAVPGKGQRPDREGRSLRIDR